MPAVAIDDEEESEEMDDDERPMHEDQDGVWYGRVTTTNDVFEELMLDSAGFAHDTGRRVRKKDREEIQPVIKWIEKSKKWNDWANIEDDGEGGRTHQDEQQSTTTVERIAGPATKVFPQDEQPLGFG